MRKLLLVGLLAFSSVVASFGQSQIWLDTSFFGGQLVTYGSSSIPANGVSGVDGTVGAGLQGGWTAGFYLAFGDITGSIGSDGTLNSTGLPTDQNAQFILATGAGSTGGFNVFGPVGTFSSVANFTTAFALGTTVTIEVIAYSGSDYASSVYRGHSTAFTMVLPDPSSAAARIGDAMPGFAVSRVPEPSTVTLLGVGGLAAWLIRRRK